MTRQLPLDLPARPALGRDDFFVSPANADALAAIERWPGWPGGKLLLCGAPGAGKTHLVHVWAARSGGHVLAARQLAQTDVAALVETGRDIALEDIDRIAGDAPAERALFHLHNLALAEGRRLLLSSTEERPDLALPDLHSRIAGTPRARLHPPDDALLSAVLIKLFADRQLTVPPRVIGHLARRMERSLSVAARVVATLDSLSLARQCRITPRLADSALDIVARSGQ